MGEGPRDHAARIVDVQVADAAAVPDVDGPEYTRERPDARIECSKRGGADYGSVRNSVSGVRVEGHNCRDPNDSDFVVTAIAVDVDGWCGPAGVQPCHGDVVSTCLSGNG